MEAIILEMIKPFQVFLVPEHTHRQDSAPRLAIEVEVRGIEPARHSHLFHLFHEPVESAHRVAL